MTILSSVTLTKIAFTWDPNDPNYSTNGHYDAAKIKAGTGSCYLDLVVSSVDVDPNHFSHLPSEQSSTQRASVVGVGVIPP